MKYTDSCRTGPKFGSCSIGVSGSRARSAEGFTTAPESRWAPATRPLSSTAIGTSPRRLGGGRVVGQQLAQADGAGQARRPAADEEHADVDALVLGRCGSATNSRTLTGGG